MTALGGQLQGRAGAGFFLAQIEPVWPPGCPQICGQIKIKSVGHQIIRRQDQGVGLGCAPLGGAGA